MKETKETEILLNLTHSQLVHLVKGNDCPPYEVMKNPLLKKSGYYIGGFVDKWNWETCALEEFSKEELIKLYQLSSRK